MQTLVITGISRGIGLEIAKTFLNKNWTVIGTSTTGSSPIKHKNLRIYKLDLTIPEQIDAFVKELPKIDVLINNAAVLLETWNDEKINMSLLKETFAINLFGTIELTEKCIPKFNDGAQIINISSGWGAFSSNNSPFQPHYKMSKASLNMYTKLLAERFPQMTVSSFDPGWVKTNMGTQNAKKLPGETAQEIYDLINMKKKSGYFWFNGKPRDW
ncbi:TPA: SDR family NAD(P)-dependent oxidoreductase [Legionella pneumophila]|uniref:SDR family NAD(P)-dependent oxidoreductase n=1 Tax=Legionella pneumophila TaxID=446 RepID=A0A2S6EZK0_LEGPN|nr:SDR family NAD(P)-dependent oxidoreductase [Legionella pneumophila]APF03145.1 short-chain dehydrogenase [Legionella pneumophila subsp. fraseri]APF06175.1 short-chain dehydrogenase [Legionella pneumophila subsp. fraseri]AUB68632.1 short-chain dehydrogenase [Legionella pneumophila]AUB71604.1 short-chain dehydrogenase [Legionella pneumophila]KXB23981.1 short-chain dehydrogenase [Legionella pneumophila]